MTPKLRTLIAMAFAVAGIALALISKVQASSASDKAELTALMQRLLAAYSHKDVSAIMAFYSDDQDAIFFEDTVPFQMNKAQLSNLLETGYKSISVFQAHAESCDFRVSGGLAAGHCVVRNAWTDKNGEYTQTSRLTDVFRKEGGKWLIWNEHFSVPFDPSTGKAVLNAGP